MLQCCQIYLARDKSAVPSASLPNCHLHRRRRRRRRRRHHCYLGLQMDLSEQSISLPGKSFGDYFPGD